MTTISKPLAPASARKNLRPFDARRDLKAVADLVELCFADTLDADGKSYLRRLRSAAKSAGLLRWTALFTEYASVPLSGYVWEQDNRLVGNINLIPYYVGSRRFYLIANVAVHPEYRRQGIARNLTEKAIEHARRRGTPSIWLHVRQENDAAVELYRLQGFVERARRTTWYSRSESEPDKSLKGVRLVQPSARDWERQRAWLLHNYPPQVSWHMPFNLNTLRPGLLGAFLRLLYNVHIQQWALKRAGRLLGAVAWQATHSHANALWLAVPPEVDEKLVYALLVQARRQAPSQRSLMLDFPAGCATQAIQAAGFGTRQTLIWMSLSLDRNQ